MPPRHENLRRLRTILAERAMTLPSLASHLGISERTVYRYLQTLLHEDDSLQIVEGADGKTRYAIHAESSSEAPNLEVLQTLLNQLSNQGNQAAAIELKSLLKDSQNNGIGEQLIRTHKHFFFDPGPFAEHNALARKPRHSKVIESIDNKRVLKITYKRSDQNQTFEFSPCKYILRMGRLYLLGYEHPDGEQLRILSDARIATIQTTSKKFSHSTHIDPIELYRFVFGQFIPPADEKKRAVKVHLHTKSEWLIRILEESHFHPPARIQPKRSGSDIILEVYLTNEFKRWLKGLLPEVDILSPKYLKEEIKEELEAALKGL